MTTPDASRAHGETDASRVSLPRRTFLGKVGALVATAALPVWGGKRLAAADAGPAPIINAETYVRGEGGYETQRRGAVWQALKPARFPDVIVQAETKADITETLRYARERRLPIAVRSGGHSYVASFLRDGGILLDLSRFREVKIDRENRTVAVQPGIRSAELSTLLEEHDLAFPVAHVATVSLGGYLLGGGMGWNGDWWGKIACANVRAVEIVTAAGESLTVNARSHPDLFAAARGAGPTFCGVATRFHLDAFPRPRMIMRSRYTYPLEAAPIVARWLHEAARQRHPNLELTLVLESEPADPSQGGAGYVRYCFASATCFAAEETQAMAALGALSKAAPGGDAVQREEFRPVTMLELFAASHSGAARRIAADNIWTHRPVEAVAALVPHYAAAPSPHSVAITNFRTHSGVVDDTFFSVMAPVYLMWIASWDASQGDSDNLHWVDEAAQRLQPFSGGSYINETDFFSRHERARDCFSKAAWERLQAVLARHDPMGLFASPFPI
ncbi:MAG: FAD-binding oxidoreductase [Burkholderiales bacterium]